MSRRVTSIAALLLFAALTVVMTWPQARLLSTHVPDADDPLLSIWRIAWIAHILPVNPADLMNGNIFHPEPRTLAYTDSVLMQALVAAPLLRSGLSPVLTYNLIVLASIALSGWTMFLYARHLTGSASAGVLAGIVFAFVPWRWRDVPAERRAGVLRAGVAATVTGAVVVLPYLAVYMLNRASLGERDPRDSQAYSATLQNYLATPTANVLHGGWSGQLGENERRLFPGAVALAIAAIGVIGLERRRATLLAVGALGFVISLGVNTPFYSWLTSVLFIYNGLRAPARASILSFLALAGLVAFGWSRLESRLQRSAPAARRLRVARRPTAIGGPRTAALHRRSTRHPARRHLHVPQHGTLAADRERLQRLLPEVVSRIDGTHEDVSGRRVDCVPENAASGPGRDPWWPDGAGCLWRPHQRPDDEVRL